MSENAGRGGNSGSGPNDYKDRKINQAPANKGADSTEKAEHEKLAEQSLQRMEALLNQSAMGIHILFDNDSIAGVMKQNKDEKDFFDFEKMQKVQNVMTALVAKKTYIEKVSYLHELQADEYEMLVRTYFHIVENTVRASHQFPH